MELTEIVPKGHIMSLRRVLAHAIKWLYKN